MPTKSPPLLCELHTHSRWSDGSLTLRELCDLYGRRGFDVLAVTDHAPRDERQIHAGSFPAYLAAVEAEARRARELYDLLVIPGLEITYDDPDPLQAAHVVAVGLREYVAVDEGLETALASARAHGAALVARFELFNRHTLFGWVAAAGHPAVATGDFHRVDHLHTWKTLLPCAKDEEAVVGYLRSARPAFLARFDAPQVSAGDHDDQDRQAA